MDRLRRSIRRSIRRLRKKDNVPDCQKPHQWVEDEKKVREGNCSFQVKYLGCVEVFESRGMYVCEQAIKDLKTEHKWKKRFRRLRGKGKFQRAILYVSGDALRVVDEITKGLIVDQTIEKVSFCAPDRYHEKGFAYICRDGTTRRWLCHGFMAIKESGERLSHAVGCAFAVCLEKKQKRERDTGVTVKYNEQGTTFERTGSFRQTTLTERLADPQSAILVESADASPSSSKQPAIQTAAVQRPHAPPKMIERAERAGSFRPSDKLSNSSPFKRQLSLQLGAKGGGGVTSSSSNRLLFPLTSSQSSTATQPSQNGLVSPIVEERTVSSKVPDIVHIGHDPGTEHLDDGEGDDGDNDDDSKVTAMCQELTQGLNALSATSETSHSPSLVNSANILKNTNIPGDTNRQAPPFRQPLVPQVKPVSETNPWANATSTTSTTESHQQSTNSIDFNDQLYSLQPFVFMPISRRPPGFVRPYWITSTTSDGITNVQRMNQSSGKSSSFDVSELFKRPQGGVKANFTTTSAMTGGGPQGDGSRRKPTLAELAQQRHLNAFQSIQSPASQASPSVSSNGPVVMVNGYSGGSSNNSLNDSGKNVNTSNSSPSTIAAVPQKNDGNNKIDVDPFEQEWAAKASNSPSSTFYSKKQVVNSSNTTITTNAQVVSNNNNGAINNNNIHQMIPTTTTAVSGKRNTNNTNPFLQQSNTTQQPREEIRPTFKVDL